MYEFLRKVPLFAGLPEEDLDRLCQMVEEVHLAPGEELFAEGSIGDKAYVIELGEVEIIKTSANRPVLLAVRRSGDVIGEIALLEAGPRMAAVRARSKSRLLSIGQKQFDSLLETSPTASQILMRQVVDRLRTTNSALRQSEKMAQLGTLTAGVAHELNNPAAAVKRGADQLEDAIAAFGLAQAALGALGLSVEQQAAMDRLNEQTRASAGKPQDNLDALTRSDREYELEDWLDERGAPDAWELAPALVNLGYDVDGLATFAADFAPEHLPAVVGWLSASYGVYNLLAEIGQGAGRISEIVKALKAYAYLDQAPVQAVDLHEGLDNTLLILRSKLKQITVVRDYAADLPKIQGYGSELNQVWTNLLDNAADAISNQAEPTITIQTERRGEWVRVRVMDNGPGIPPEIQSRVFDAFFTTKEPGKGTGLGLEISYNIIVNKHRGDLRLFSRPGLTCFQADLPVNFEAAVPIQTGAEGVMNSDEELKRILTSAQTIAVVGLSSNPDRPGYTVPAYLQSKGYRIIPVNPNLDEALGEKAYPHLLAVPDPVDVVQIFRPSQEVMPIVEHAIRKGVPVVWMQEGVVNEEAAILARNAGLDVVMNTCMRATHRRLMG
jgi:predicted CoA-binding protein/signal transduction histidine kinase